MPLGSLQSCVEVPTLDEQIALKSVELGKTLCRADIFRIRDSARVQVHDLVVQSDCLVVAALLLENIRECRRRLGELAAQAGRGPTSLEQGLGGLFCGRKVEVLSLADD